MYGIATPINLFSTLIVFNSDQHPNYTFVAGF